MPLLLPVTLAVFIILTFSSSLSANLSDSYFTNRQDRYILLRDSPEIADFFTELVNAIGDVSLQLQEDDTVQMIEGMVHPYQGMRRSSLPALGMRWSSGQWK